MEYKILSSLNTSNAVPSILVVPLFEDASYVKNGPKEAETLLKNREMQKDFQAKQGEIMVMIPDQKNLPGKIILWGLGEKKKLTSQKIRGLSAQLARAIRPLKKGEFALWCTDAMGSLAQALGEGLAFGNYTLAKFKTGKEQAELAEQTLRKISFILPKPLAKFEEKIRKGLMIAEAVGETRDDVNAGPSLKTAEYLAEKSRKIARENGYSIRIFDKRELEKMGMNGILGVNRGSDIGAKLVVMEYTPKGTAKNPPVVLVGKGVIFDSGGYNLKPSMSLFEMQLDMAGAAAVMGLFKLLKKTGIKQRVVGIFPLTDNLVDAKSQKPSDVVTTYSGKTVEIINTDAEGRMILCDAISYGVKQYKPRYLIDVATLTGACMIALGDRYAGLFGNDAGLTEKLRKAGEATDELAWPMPIHPDHRAKMKSKIADLRNWDEVPHAGASKGAAFLQEFVGDTKWAHLDIAGPAFVKDPKPYDSQMGTGFGIRLFLDFLENLR